MNKQGCRLRDRLLFLVCSMLVLGALLPVPAMAQDPTPTSGADVPGAQCAGPDSTALDHYRRATEFDRAGQNEEAAQEYLLTIQCDNNYVMAYRGLARAYQQQDRVDEAIALFEQMLEGNPQNALVHYAIGWLHMGQDEWEETEAEFQAALDIDPECAIALNAMGTVYEHQGDKEAALAMYRAAMVADPGLEFPRQNILNVQLASLADDEIAEFIASLEDNLRLDPQQEFADEKVYLIGALYAYLGQSDRNRDSCQRLLTEYPDSLWADYAYGGIALSYLAEDQYEQAVEPLTILISEFPDSALAGKMRIMLGEVYLFLDNDAEAYRLITEGLYEYPDPGPELAAGAQAYLDSLETEAAEAFRLTNKGFRAREHADFEGALAYCEQAAQIAVSQSLADAEMEALSCLGATYEDLGHYSEAKSYYQEWLDLAQRQGKNELGIGRAYGGLGNVATDLREYYVAISYYEQALQHLEQVPDSQASPSLVRREIANAYNDIGAIHYLLGHYELARDWIQRALDETSGSRTLTMNRVSAIMKMANLGLIYGKLGEPDTALKYLSQALDLCEGENRLADMLVKPHYNIGEIYVIMGQFEEALNEFKIVLQTAVETEVPYWELIARQYIGRVYGMQGNYKTALAEFEIALDVARELRHLDSEAEILHWMGDCYRHLGQTMTALQYYHDAVAVVETYAGSLSAGGSRAELLGQIGSSFYSDLVTLLIKMGEDHEAFEFSERARARTFLDSLANGRIDFREGATLDLLERERTLCAEITALDSNLRTQISQPHDEQDVQVIDRLQEQLEEKRNEYSLLLNQIQATNPEYASLAMVSTLPLTQTQQSLDDQTTLVEYLVTSEETVAFVLTHDSFNAITISVGSQQLTDEVTTFRDFASPEQPHPESLIQLYGWLIAPIRPYLNTPVVGIVPHGVLHYLPFAALTDGEHYLVDDFTLFSLPNASVLPFIQEHAVQTSNSSLAAFAQPDAEGRPHLAYAEQEVETIATLWETQAVAGSDATETAVREQVPGAEIVHIAAHGEFNPYNPLFSAVLLGGDEQNDGRLEVHEVYGLDLTQASLVVLSGCQTDMGHLTDGDELIGLNRAFLFAGTPTVVGSLWQVDDASTSFLMERFYVHLRDGMSKAEALRQAQLDTRERYPHPYYWAGFVLTGDYAGTMAVRQEAISEVTAVPATPTPDSDGGGRTPWWVYASGIAIIAFVGVGVWVLMRRRG